MKPGVKSRGAYYDLDHGFLQIFPDSLRAETLVEEDEGLRAARNPRRGL